MKPGDRVKVQVAQAGLVPQQLNILKKMLKNGGDGMVLIKSIDGDYANVAGWEGDSLLGTLRIPVKALREDSNRITSKFYKMIESIDPMNSALVSKFIKLSEDADYKILSDDSIQKLSQEDAKKENDRVEKLIRDLRQHVFDVDNPDEDKLGDDIDVLKTYMFKLRKRFAKDNYKHWMYAAESLSKGFMDMVSEEGGLIKFSEDISDSDLSSIADKASKEPDEDKRDEVVADELSKKNLSDQDLDAASSKLKVLNKLKTKSESRVKIIRLEHPNDFKEANRKEVNESKAKKLIEVIEKDHDFLGEYDWPEEEAIGVADHVNAMISSGDYTKEEAKQRVDKDLKHFAKVFGDDEQGKRDMKRFREVLMDRLSFKIDF